MLYKKIIVEVDEGLALEQRLQSRPLDFLRQVFEDVGERAEAGLPNKNVEIKILKADRK